MFPLTSQDILGGLWTQEGKAECICCICLPDLSLKSYHPCPFYVLKTPGCFKTEFPAFWIWLVTSVNRLLRALHFCKLKRGTQAGWHVK